MGRIKRPSILAVVWVVAILSLTSTSASLSSKSFGTVPSAPTTIGITATFMFEIFNKIQIFIYLFAFFYLHSVMQNLRLYKSLFLESFWDEDS